MAIDPSKILLTGRVAVITGGGAGIGRGIAEGMAAFGASVAIWERDPDTCAATAESIGVLGITTDVRDSEQVDAALERTAGALGEVSILVNNAGGVFDSPLLDTSENGWDALYKSNLRHVLLCTQQVARRLVAAGLPGSVINVTSIEGVRAAPGYAAYAVPGALGFFMVSGQPSDRRQWIARIERGDRRRCRERGECVEWLGGRDRLEWRQRLKWDQRLDRRVAGARCP